PREYSLVLLVRDPDTRWSIGARKISLRAGEQEETVSMPAIHTLRVRASPALRARDVTIQSSDPALGWLRRVKLLEEGVATFDALAAAQYEVRCGSKRVEVRVPAAGEIAIE
ncbi:MAG: hypothetical protein L6Q95_04925, partial [Planctomycetes bacterium]|nr:hypothetical protein [Planctomycetota bacterium]